MLEGQQACRRRTVHRSYPQVGIRLWVMSHGCQNSADFRRAHTIQLRCGELLTLWTRCVENESPRSGEWLIFREFSRSRSYFRTFHHQCRRIRNAKSMHRLCTKLSTAVDEIVHIGGNLSMGHRNLRHCGAIGPCWTRELHGCELLTVWITPVDNSSNPSRYDSGSRTFAAPQKVIATRSNTTIASPAHCINERCAPLGA